MVAVAAVAGMALAVHGKMTTKIPEQGKPIWYSIPHIEVSNDLLHGIFFGLMLHVEHMNIHIEDIHRMYNQKIGHIIDISTTCIPRRLITLCKQVM
jgi:hypothetical protein